MRRALLQLLIVFLVGLSLAAVWTWPLLPNLGSSLPFDPNSAGPSGSDMHIWTWNFWWAGEAATGGGQSFHSDAIFAPFGHSLAFHTHSFLYGLVTLPLQWLGGAAFAVGMALLLLPAAAFTATFALARELGTSRFAAGVAAFGWAFAPYFLQKGLEHLCFVASPWPPLLALFLLRWMGPGRAWPAALGAGVVAGLALLSGSMVGLFLVLFGVAIAVFAPSAPAESRGEAFRSRRRRLLEPGPLLLFLVAAGCLSLPLLTEARSEALDLADFEARHAQSADFFARDVAVQPQLSDFLRLSAQHPLASLPDQPQPGWNEVSALHVSGVLIVLAALALTLARGRRSWAWLGIALLFLLLSWDPVLAAADGGVFSSIYRRLPFLDALRVPARFLPFALLPLCLLAGLGFDVLRHRSRPAAILLLGLLVVEQWSRAVPLMDVTPPPAVVALEALPRRPGGGDTVLSLPVQMGASEAMTWQAVHGRPVLFSFVSRTNPRALRFWMETAPDLFALVIPRMTRDGSVFVPGAEALSIDLEGLGIGDVLVDEAALGAAGPELLALLTELLDSMPGWERQPVEGRVAWWRRVA
ncbi:MAG: hypothetical protein P1V81_15905 [Planctomycetota bacterium]|nr:hypothetical protein [Planctomycetota bacterium]